MLYLLWTALWSVVRRIANHASPAKSGGILVTMLISGSPDRVWNIPRSRHRPMSLTNPPVPHVPGSERSSCLASTTSISVVEQPP